MTGRWREGARELPLVPWAIGALVVLVALALWQGHGYWEYSDGVYSLSARQLLDGQDLYRDFAGAQPPTLFYLGAGALVIEDSPSAMRVAMAACQAATSLLVLVAVWRLTGSRVAALVAGLLALLTPWSVREHAQFLPETVAAPLVLATALLASSRRRAAAVAGGVLAVVAASLKLPIALPALAAVAAGRDARRGLVAAALTGLAGAGLFALAFGTDGWDSVVRAQREAGYASASYVTGLWGQGAWNLLPLAVPAALAWLYRDRMRHPDLARTLVAALAGAFLLLGTLLKNGSSLTVMVVLEPLVLCFAVTGGALMLGGREDERPRGAVAAVAAAALLGVAQVASLLAAPSDPKLFSRPLADSGPERVLSSGEVDRQVAALRRCPPGAAATGPPYLAFRAGRRIAGAQPDQFIVANAPVLVRFRRAAAAEPALCPQP